MFAARAEFEGLFSEGLDDLADGACEPGRRVEDTRQIREIDEPSRMVEQVVDRNLVPVVRTVWEVLTDGIADTELALLCQDHDGHRCELFGDGPDSEFGVG